MPFATQIDAFEHFEMTVPQYLASARMLAKQLLTEQCSITVDDIRKQLPPPSNVDGRVMGAIFKTPDFEACGYIKSERRECHHRPLTQYRLCHK